MVGPRWTSALGLLLVGCGGAQSAVTGAPAPVVTVAPEPPPPPPAGPPVQVDCGDFTTCATTGEGAVRCWGHDKKGELGDGGGTDKSRIVAVEVGKVKSMAMGSQFACALLEAGTVKCWGSGRIANDGVVREKSKPVDVKGVEGVEEIAASGALVCARAKTGVTCWGSDPSVIGQPPKGEFKQIATGFSHGCALDKAGAVTCWGTGDWATKGAYGKPAVTGALQVATGDRHACVVTKAQRVACWGQNDAGQLGTKPDGDAHKKLVEVAGVSGVARVVCGESSTCALGVDGTVRCWGANGEGELGLGSRSVDERPAKVASLTEVKQMCIATQHGCALTKAGKISCWGANAFGQLGDGTRERRLQPTSVAW